MNDHSRWWSTFDFSRLTQFVVLCHDKCIRGEIMPASSGYMKIAIWRREREGSISERHPTLEENIESMRKWNLEVEQKIK